MRGNVHFIINAANFTLTEGGASLTEYRFGSHTARHLFCSVCGITPFYHPRSNPDGIAITVACIDAGTLDTVEERTFDGRNWESAFAATGIAACSNAALTGTRDVTYIPLPKK